MSDFEFDKFMDDIVIKEHAHLKRDAKDEELTPQQLRNKRRENVNHLIKFNKN